MKSLSLSRAISQYPPNKSHRNCPVGLDYLGTWGTTNLVLHLWLPGLIPRNGCNSMIINHVLSCISWGKTRSFLEHTYRFIAKVDLTASLLDCSQNGRTSLQGTHGAISTIFCVQITFCWTYIVEEKDEEMKFRLQGISVELQPKRCHVPFHVP